MKVGIVTITLGQNYGNRLQNYAVQRILEKRNYNVRTLREKEWNNTFTYRVKACIRKRLGYNWDKKSKRIEKFEEFNKKYIKFDKHFWKKGKEKFRYEKKYDKFIVGSDQVWNTKFEIIGKEYFLSFIKNKPKVSLAASIGLDYTDSKLYLYSDLLEKFNGISVREEKGKQILSRIIEKEISVLIDPTLMIDADEWEKIEENKSGISTKYIFCYLLGNYSVEYTKKIRKYANDRNLKIYFACADQTINSIETNDIEFSFSPGEFIYLIHNAEKVITDSYHAVILSLLFDRKYLVIDREDSNVSMKSRFKTLENIFKIENMFCENDDFSKNAKVKREIFDRELKKKRREFNEFIDKYI